MLWKDDVNILFTPKHKYGAYHYDTALYPQLSYLSFHKVEKINLGNSICQFLSHRHSDITSHAIFKLMRYVRTVSFSNQQHNIAFLLKY